MIVLSILHRRRPHCRNKKSLSTEVVCQRQLSHSGFRMHLQFGIKIIELILEINYSVKNITFNCLLCNKYNEHRDEAIS